MDLHKDFDYSQIYSLNQTSLIENLHIKSPKKKGRKPNLVKIKDQIDQGIQTTLDNYTNALGKFINWHKSKVLFFNVDLGVQRHSCGVLKMKVGILPSTYL